MYVLWYSPKIGALFLFESCILTRVFLLTEGRRIGRTLMIAVDTKVTEESEESENDEGMDIDPEENQPALKKLKQ